MNTVINNLLTVKGQIVKLQANQKKVRVKKVKEMPMSTGSISFYEIDPATSIEWIIGDIERGYLELIELLRKKAKVRKPKRKK